LPDEELSKLDETAEKMMSFISPFEEEMKRLEFYKKESSSDEATTTPLSKFVSSFHQNYIEKRRTTILDEARDLLLNQDYHNTTKVGEKIFIRENDLDGSKEEDEFAVFLLHECAVSKTATSILALCCQTLDEAFRPTTANIPNSKGLEILSSTMYRTSREIFDMFRALIPTKFEREIATIPRTAAISHNDCVFFAHHCLSLGLKYKDQFEPFSEDEDIRGQVLRQTCFFVDMVPIFRELADNAIGNMLGKQHNRLTEIIGSKIGLFGKSLSSNESLVEWVEAETAMKAAIYHTKQLSQSWISILSNDIHRRSMGSLMNTIFNLYLTECFRADSISEPASHLVCSIFRSGMQGGIDVTKDDMSGCLAWNRFSAVGRFMEMSLADINVALADGVFRSITGGELTHLIEATFSDSDKRKKLLEALASETSEKK